MSWGVLENGNCSSTTSRCFGACEKKDTCFFRRCGSGTGMLPLVMTSSTRIYYKLLSMRRKTHRFIMSFRLSFYLSIVFVIATMILFVQILSERKENVSLLERLETTSLRLKRLENALNPVKASIVRSPRAHRRDLPVIVAITPTYTRPTQKADLTRLSLTLRQVPNFHWILVEDSKVKTDKVKRFLSKCGLHHSHLNIRTPEKMQLNNGEARWHKHRGVEQRNLGLSFVLNHGHEFLPDASNAVIYLMDDDNTYSLELFDEMRFIKRVGVWPVGLSGGLMWDGPLCDETGVTGFHALWRPDRFFPMDMAGFAFNIHILRQRPEARLDQSVHYGFLESSFISQLLNKDRSLMEPKADLCRKVLVWHTRTEKPNLKREIELNAKGQQSDPSMDV